MSVEYLVYNKICTTQLILDKFTSIAPEYTERLQSIWKEMGISVSAQHHRVEAVINYIQELLSDMVADEENLLKELIKNTEICKAELLKLGQILGLSPYKSNENLTLVEKEKDLRTKLEAWNSEKQEREKTFTKLRKKEAELCKRLALPPHDTSIGEVPTAKQVKEIEANINYMENELSKAKSQFHHARRSVLTLWEELEIDTAKTKFCEIANEESEESFVLSKENLQQLKEHLNKLEKQQEENRQQSLELTRKLKSLWTKLEINEKEQSAFKENCVGFRPSAIEKLKDEVDKYERMKLKYTEKFIIGLRKELKQLWDKCFFSEDRRSEFLPAFDENYTEESLKLHEHQVHVMQGFYEDNKDIYKLVEKRENLWERLMEIEHKENDPARLFSNRGGALLKELKKKNAVEKGLPKVEKDLKRMIEAWQKENEDVFFVNGKNYLEVIKQQQDNRKKVKDLAKLGKQKEKKEAIAKEMVYGSKPVTPAKRLNRGNSFKISMHGKRKRDDKCCTTDSMTTNSLTSSHCNSPATISSAKNKKKARRISCKIKKHQIRPYKRNSIEDTVDTSKDDDEDGDDSVHSLCTYPDFTSHIQRGREKELSSTAATVDSFQTLSPTDESEL